MSHKTSQNLTIEQENAIDLLLTGLSDNEVAKQVGVTRETVCRWRNDNAAFIVELNKRRQAIWGSSLDKLRGLIPKAIEVLEKNISTSEVYDSVAVAAAVHVLKAVGLYGADMNPATLPVSEKEIEIAAKEKAGQLSLKEMLSSPFS